MCQLGTGFGVWPRLYEHIIDFQEHSFNTYPRAPLLGYFFILCLETDHIVKESQLRAKSCSQPDTPARFSTKIWTNYWTQVASSIIVGQGRIPDHADLTILFVAETESQSIVVTAQAAHT